MSREAVDNRFPLCVVDAVKASDVELGISFTPIAGRSIERPGCYFASRMRTTIMLPAPMRWKITPIYITL
jgi:hypothetical protein